MNRAQGVVKNLLSLFTSHIVAVLQQVGLVPVFVSSYGTPRYGEWLALAAAVQYLITLDFGVQTFVVQDLTLRYQSGKMDGFHTQQSTALRILLGLVVSAAALSLLAFVLPLQQWLKLDGSNGAPAIAARDVSTIVYLFALQILVSLVFGYFAGAFMIISRAHIGNHWMNVQRLSTLAVTVCMALLHMSFVTLAASQLLLYLLALLTIIVHFYRAAPQVFPTLRYWDGAAVHNILKPSSHFALIYLGQFIVYQLPVIIMQRDLGPAIVVEFAVMRTIFSMTRQIANSFTSSLGPLITSLFATSNWKDLSLLYSYSETLILAFIPVLNVGTLLLSPVLLTFWLRKPGFFMPALYVIAAAISITAATKEHKFLFQFSTNTHTAVARLMFVSYIGLVGLMIPAIDRFGVEGFLWSWLAVELIQLGYFFRLNRVLFAGSMSLSMLPLRYLAILSAVFLAGCEMLLPKVELLPWVQQIAIAIAISAVTAAIVWRLFSLGPVLQLFIRQLQKEADPTSPF